MLWGLIAIGLCNLYGLRFIIGGEEMWRGTENHDTRIIARNLEKPHSPLQWFTGDWPLGNHFYRPIPTLAFEVDHAIWGPQIERYKISTWLFAAICPFALLWFAWELTRSLAFSVASAVLFAAWQSGIVQWAPWEFVFNLLALLAVGLGILVDRRKWGRWIGLGCVLWLLGGELGMRLTEGDFGGMSFSYRAMGWVPGRTATIMGLFALIALGSYCRFERTGRWSFWMIAFVSFLCALASYELAIMLPLAFVVCGFVLWKHKVRVHWWLHALPWLVAFAYAWWHHVQLPPTSEYRLQRRRGNHSSIRDLVTWLFPAWPSLDEVLLLFSGDVGLAALILPAFWGSLIAMGVNAYGYVVARREWVIGGAALLLSVALYGPLAFQRMLTHYFYLALAMRSLFVITLSVFALGEARALWGIKQSSRATPAV